MERLQDNLQVEDDFLSEKDIKIFVGDRANVELMQNLEALEVDPQFPVCCTVKFYELQVLFDFFRRSCHFRSNNCRATILLTVTIIK